MPEFLEEFLVVLSHSTRTVVAIVLSVAFPALILMLGDFMTTGAATVTPDPLQPLLQAVQHALYWRYVAAAVVSFFSFVGVAISCYNKDRKRLFHL